jgi:glutathione S-transferase
MADGTPVLWQIKVSHYNEKARWALDYKRVAHRRRAPFPLFGTLPTAWVLTRGITFPILQLDGRAIGDSTRIIAALEERYPEPPLYPADPAEHARALALEDFFDEELAPDVRRLAWHETMKDPRAFVAAALPGSTPLVQRALRAGSPLSAAVVRRRYGVSADTAQRARERIVTAMHRLESEIGPSGYLAGDRFSVADLTAAALFTPLVRPPERPYLPAGEFVPPLQRFCDELAEMPGSDWILDMYRRHRGTSAEIRAAG